MEKLIQEWIEWQQLQAGCYRAMHHYRMAGWLPEAREKQKTHAFAFANAMSCMEEIREEWE